PRDRPRHTGVETDPGRCDAGEIQQRRKGTADARPSTVPRTSPEHMGEAMSQILEYTDPVKGNRGYLVYDRTDCRIAAGGCRMQPGVTAETFTDLAARMTLKQRVLGTGVDGAKCGIDYDPRSPDRLEVLTRFVGWLSGQLRHRFSMGCDMGTRFEELER